MGKDLNGKELGKGLSQHKSGRYMARYTNRFGERKTIYDKNLRELKKQLKKAIAEDELELNVVTNSITLDEWFKKWLKLYKSDLRITTINDYTKVYFKHISPYIGMLEISKIKSIHIRKLLVELAEDRGVKTPLNKVIGILRSLFQTAEHNNLIKSNPASDCKAVSFTKKEKHIPTTKELVIFFKWSKNSFFHNAFIVHISTGVRPGELFGLKIQDIDLENKTIHVERTLNYVKTPDNDKMHCVFGDTKTKTSVRAIPISLSCEKALKEQLEFRKTIIQSMNIKNEFKDLLFFTTKGNPLQTATYSKAIRDIISEINQYADPEERILNFTPHAFRHLFGTICYEAGIDLKVIQKYLGHSSLSITSDIYVHLTEDAENKAINQIDAAQNYLLNNLV